MGMRDIKQPIGLTSCTYWEAVLKCKPFYNHARTSNIACGVVATLFLAYERKSMKVVEADLKRGTPE